VLPQGVQAVADFNGRGRRIEVLDVDAVQRDRVAILGLVESLIRTVRLVCSGGYFSSPCVLGLLHGVAVLAHQTRGFQASSSAGFTHARARGIHIARLRSRGTAVIGVGVSMTTEPGWRSFSMAREL
jgi:hypothetical protein